MYIEKLEFLLLNNYPNLSKIIFNRLNASIIRTNLMKI